MPRSPHLRRFLYITPYFPPQTRVGALRPLKFARHLPAHGWTPVVLADLRPSDPTDPALSAAVPSTTVVIRDYARGALPYDAPMDGRYARDAPMDGRHVRGAPAAGPTTPASSAAVPPGPLTERPPSGLRARLARFDEYASRQPWYPRPEWLPLGRHSVDIPHALAAARRALRDHPDCQAIMVNADPYAALLVGAQLARETGLPLISDLRDPWAPCELRRPKRPPPQRRLVDGLERHVVRASARMILNNERTLADYREWYSDVDPARFTCIRNHADATLIASESWPTPQVDRFRLLFLGHLRRFVVGDHVLEAMASLARAGAGLTPIELVVSGQVTPEARRTAQALGIADRLVAHPFVPYTQIGGFMDSCHALLAINTTSAQRVPAKLYDYLASHRPVIVMTATSPEIERIVAPFEHVQILGLHDVAGLSRALDRLRAAGLTHVKRDLGDLSSERASARLAEILNAVTEPDGAPAP